MSARLGRTLPLLAVATTLSLVAGCSADSSAAEGSASAGTPNGTGSSTAKASAPASSTSPSAPSRVDVRRVPTELKALTVRLYEGGSVPATGAAKAPLTVRRPGTGRVTVTANLGVWRGTPIAVLSAGQDATLAVKGENGWYVVGGWWPSMAATGPFLGGRRHVLFIGSDARTERGQNLLRANADALQLVGVDGKGGSGIMGMARDLYVPLSTGGRGKINSALARGGPQAQAATVADVTGIPVEGYVLTGMQDFSRLISEMGGVVINAPRRVRDVPKGTSRVFGPDALWYGRERKTVPGGDFGRAANQAHLMYSLAAQTRGGGAKALVDTLTKASSRVQTNLSAAQALTLGAWVYKADPTKTGRAVAKGPIGTSSGGASIVVLGSEAKGVFARFRDGSLG